MGMRTLPLLILAAGAAACRQPVTHVHVDEQATAKPMPGQFTAADHRVSSKRAAGGNSEPVRRSRAPSRCT